MVNNATASCGCPAKTPIYDSVSDSCQPCPKEMPIWNGKKCVACPAGTFFEEKLRTCVVCAPGQSYDSATLTCVND